MKWVASAVWPECGEQLETSMIKGFGCEACGHYFGQTALKENHQII